MMCICHSPVLVIWLWYVMSKYLWHIGTTNLLLHVHWSEYWCIILFPGLFLQGNNFSLVLVLHRGHTGQVIPLWPYWSQGSYSGFTNNVINIRVVLPVVLAHLTATWGGAVRSRFYSRLLALYVHITSMCACIHDYCMLRSPGLPVYHTLSLTWMGRHIINESP